jgi:non-specific serine/threonine protein kinase
VQNNTFDLYAQMNFLNPGMLGSQEFFRTEFAGPIDKNGDKEAATRLRRLVYPFMLRRTKEQVAADLPDKTEMILWCEMGPEQKKIYNSFKEHYRESILEHISGEGMGKSSIYILEGLTKLRQICDSPAILKGEGYPNTSAKLDELIREIEENTGIQSISPEVFPGNIAFGLKSADDGPSAQPSEAKATESAGKGSDEGCERSSNEGERGTKLRRSSPVVHKALVFSQFTSMLQLIREALEQRGISYLYLDGGVAAGARRTSVQQFQEDGSARVFLISLKAGGVGLTLTAADYVYLVDPWWNPAAEQQAIDRSHRIGQAKKVFAYRMICKDTVEEKILQLQEKKRGLVADLVSDETGFVKKLTEEDVAYLFS